MFDCAFKPARGVRSIHYMGHIRMMGAVQPFLSGAISKTVNVPKEATRRGDPAGLHRFVAHGRQGGVDLSRRQQAHAAAEHRRSDKEKVAAVAADGRADAGAGCRTSAHAITHKFDIAGHEGYITVGLFEDGTPGEIFLVMAKEGSTISGFADAFAQAISYALQYGVPLQDLVDKFSHVRFEPSGMTKNPDVRFAKSIVDYIFRWMAAKFLSPEAQFRAGVNNREETVTTPEQLPLDVRRGRRRVADRRDRVARRCRRSRRCRTRKTRRRARPAGRSWCAAARATSARTAARPAAALRRRDSGLGIRASGFCCVASCVSSLPPRFGYFCLVVASAFRRKNTGCNPMVMLPMASDTGAMTAGVSGPVPRITSLLIKPASAVCVTEQMQAQRVRP